MSDESIATSSQPAKRELIYEMLPKAAAQIGAVGKGSENKQQNYKYRGIDAALSACGPVLARNGISLRVKYYEIKTNRGMVKAQSKGGDAYERLETHVMLMLDLSFFATDGSSITQTVPGEGWDVGGDKATNKAMSAAMKYALYLGLCVAVEGGVLDDSDRDGKEEGGPPRRDKPQKKWPETPPGETDYIKLVQKLLRDAGCKTSEDACCLLAFATEGEYREPKQYKASQADANLVVRALLKLFNREGGLQKALTDAIDAAALNQDTAGAAVDETIQAGALDSKVAPEKTEPTSAEIAKSAADLAAKLASKIENKLMTEATEDGLAEALAFLEQSAKNADITSDVTARLRALHGDRLAKLKQAKVKAAAPAIVPEKSGNSQEAKAAETNQPAAKPAESKPPQQSQVPLAAAVVADIEKSITEATTVESLKEPRERITQAANKASLPFDEIKRLRKMCDERKDVLAGAKKGDLF